MTIPGLASLVMRYPDVISKAFLWFNVQPWLIPLLIEDVDTCESSTVILRINPHRHSRLVHGLIYGSGNNIPFWLTNYLMFRPRIRFHETLPTIEWVLISYNAYFNNLIACSRFPGFFPYLCGDKQLVC